MPTGVTHCISNACQKATNAFDKQANRAIWESPFVAPNQQISYKNQS
jgi:hypothetical protein